MEEQQQVWELIKTGEAVNIEIAVELAFSLNIDIRQEQLLELHHDLFPLDIYKKKKEKLVKLLALQNLGIENYLPPYLQYLPNLKNIRLQGQFDATNLKELWRCAALEAIEIYGLNTLELGFQFHRLTQLATLRIIASKIRSIHKDLRKAIQINTLLLHSNRQLNFPSLTSFPNLEILTFVNNQFPKRRIEEIISLKKLKRLHLAEKDYKKTELDRLRKALPNCKITN